MRMLSLLSYGWMTTTRGLIQPMLLPPLQKGAVVTILVFGLKQLPSQTYADLLQNVFAQWEWLHHEMA